MQRDSVWPRRALPILAFLLATPAWSAGPRPVLALVPLGTVPSEVVAELEQPLADAFDVDVVVLPPVELPEGSLDPARTQYASSAILDALVPLKDASHDCLLGIADVDLFSPGLSFVFGEADDDTRVAVFSVKRLRPRGESGTYAAALLRRRALTEAIHEIGHCHGLRHCDDDRCVMWFSNTVAESDRKGIDLCRTHARELRRLVRTAQEARAKVGAEPGP